MKRRDYGSGVSRLPISRRCSPIATILRWPAIRPFAPAPADLQPGAPGTDFQFAVGLKADGLLIGDVYFSVEATGRQAEIGYTLAAEFQGCGYATEAVRGVLGFAFERIGLHRVTAGADPRNLPSLRLLERLGFRREGYSPESYWDGEMWTDDVRYAMLAREWRARPH